MHRDFGIWQLLHIYRRTVNKELCGVLNFLYLRNLWVLIFCSVYHCVKPSIAYVIHWYELLFPKICRQWFRVVVRRANTCANGVNAHTSFRKGCFRLNRVMASITCYCFIMFARLRLKVFFSSHISTYNISLLNSGVVSVYSLNILLHFATNYLYWWLLFLWIMGFWG